MAAKASATNHLPDPSGRATTRRWRFPEAVGGVASARDASRRLLLLASMLRAARSDCRRVLLCCSDRRAWRWLSTRSSSA